MNRVYVIMPNPQHIEEVELDRDEVDPEDLTPLISGDTPIITVPALEVEDTAEEAVEDKDGDVAEEFVKDMMRMRTWMMCWRSWGSPRNF